MGNPTTFPSTTLRPYSGSQGPIVSPDRPADDVGVSGCPQYLSLSRQILTRLLTHASTHPYTSTPVRVPHTHIYTHVTHGHTRLRRDPVLTPTTRSGVSWDPLSRRGYKTVEGVQGYVSTSDCASVLPPRALSNRPSPLLSPD